MEKKIKISNKCQKSNVCEVFCPEDAFFSIQKKLFVDDFKCTLCGICLDVCPSDAITINLLEPEAIL